MQNSPKPHHTGNPLKLWSFLLLSTIVSILTAVMIVYGIQKLAFIFIGGIFREASNGNLPIYLIVLVFLVLTVILWWGFKSKMLLSFAKEYMGTVVLGFAAFFIGFFERGKPFEGKIAYRIIRTVAFVLVAVVIVLAYFSIKQETHKDSLGFISSFLITLSIYFIFALTKLILGCDDDWRALVERVQLQLFTLKNADFVDFTEIPLIHLSDLHVTCSDTAPLAENPKIGVSDSTLDSLAQAIVFKHPMPIVVSGDATDTGNAQEWERFTRYFGPFKDRIVVAPGNHDLNIVGYGKSSLFTVTDLLHYGGRINRLRAYLSVAVDMMGGGVYVPCEMMKRGGLTRCIYSKKRLQVSKMREALGSSGN